MATSQNAYSSEFLSLSMSLQSLSIPLEFGSAIHEVSTLSVLACLLGDRVGMKREGIDAVQILLRSSKNTWCYLCSDVDFKEVWAAVKNIKGLL